MILHRNRWARMLAALAVGLQFLLGSGLALSATWAPCATAQAQPMADCGACATDDPGTAPHSGTLCKVACAAAGAAAPLPFSVPVSRPCRDRAAGAVAAFQDRSTPDDLLRPPAGAALLAA